MNKHINSSHFIECIIEAVTAKSLKVENELTTLAGQFFIQTIFSHISPVMYLLLEQRFVTLIFLPLIFPLFFLLTLTY